MTGSPTKDTNRRSPLAKRVLLSSTHPDRLGLSSFARSITTKDFRSNNNLSWVISTSSNGINTGVDRFDGAHNNTALTYDFYNETYKRDSIDGRGLRLVINVDYTPMGPFTTDIAAYHSGMKQVYVAPEGELYYSMATSLDVVAHEVGTASD
jgi:Zn-dependent metalloprotease